MNDEQEVCAILNRIFGQVDYAQEAADEVREYVTRWLDGAPECSCALPRVCYHDIRQQEES